MHCSCFYHTPLYVEILFVYPQTSDLEQAHTVSSIFKQTEVTKYDKKRMLLDKQNHVKYK